MTPEQKRANVRLGLAIAAIALLLFVGILFKGAMGGL